jgi:hypothetical protein
VEVTWFILFVWRQGWNSATPFLDWANAARSESHATMLDTVTQKEKFFGHFSLITTARLLALA